VTERSEPAAPDDARPVADSLQSLAADVDWPDSDASTDVRERLVSEPGLGRLAGLAEWVAGVRPPGLASFARVRLLVIGGGADDLVADTAAAVGALVRSVPGDGAVRDGIALADQETDTGTDLLLLAAPGVRADAATAVAVLTNTEPVKVLARGAAASDPEAWMRTAVEVRDARRRCLPYREDPDRLLAEIGSDRLAVAAGVILRSAVRRTPVVVDGPVAAAAALVAYEAQPRAVRWWSAADQGPDPLHELVLDRLGQRPVLGLGTGLGDGLAALLCIPVIRVAARIAGPGEIRGDG
jgi:NaMN:DMB phosphoribosyltransferase